jgi:hypothetical protein
LLLGANTPWNRVRFTLGLGHQRRQLGDKIRDAMTEEEVFYGLLIAWISMLLVSGFAAGKRQIIYQAFT